MLGWGTRGAAGLTNVFLSSSYFLNYFITPFSVFGSSIEMPNAEELRAPIPLEPLLGTWAHGTPSGKERLKDLFSNEDTTMQSALRYAARKEHSTLTNELSNLS